MTLNTNDIHDAPTRPCDLCRMPTMLDAFVVVGHRRICVLCNARFEAWCEKEDAQRLCDAERHELAGSGRRERDVAGTPAITAAQLRAWAVNDEGSPVIEDRFHPAFCPDCGKPVYKQGAVCVSTACNPASEEPDE